MNIVIVGSTGLVGTHLLSSLLTNGRVMKITVISRREVRCSSAKVTQIIEPKLDEEFLKGLSLEGDVFICALGTTINAAGSREAFSKVDKDLVLAFSELAGRTGAKALFVVSALGAKKKSAIFYNRIKGEMEERLPTVEVPCIYVLRPSLLIGKRTEKRLGERVGNLVYGFLKKALPKKYLWLFGTEVEDIAKYINQKIGKHEVGYHVVHKF